MGFIIAIDGPAAAGKSTTARLVAERLGFVHLNTGMMYRAAAYVLLEHKSIEASGREAVKVLESAPLEFRMDLRVRVYYKGRELADKQLHSSEIDNLVAVVAAKPEIRELMVNRQREMGRSHNIVCEGRDIGSVVFPEADLKVFMKCDLEERARRRADSSIPLSSLSLSSIKDNLEERDRLDQHREISPLVQLPESFVVDTTNLTIDQQVGIVEQEARRRMAP